MTNIFSNGLKPPISAWVYFLNLDKFGDLTNHLVENPPSKPWSTNLTFPPFANLKSLYGLASLGRNFRGPMLKHIMQMRQPTPPNSDHKGFLYVFIALGVMMSVMDFDFLSLTHWEILRFAPFFFFFGHNFRTLLGLAAN